MSKIITKWIEDDAITKEKVNVDVAGNGLVQNVSGALDANPDDVTIEVVSDALQVKDGGIGTSKLAATSVTAAKLGAVAGDGLTGGSGSVIDVDPDTVGGANLAEAINVTANGVAVKVDDTTVTQNASKQLTVAANGIDATHIDEGDDYTWTGTHDFTGGVVHVAAPSNDNHAVNKGYVDTAIEGLQNKGNAKAHEAGNVASLSGLPTNIDGVTSWSDGDIVLLSGQTTGTENGLWVVHTSAWTRPDNFTAGLGASGALVWVDTGVNYGETAWRCTTDEPNDVIGTDSLTFVQYPGATAINAGTCLTKTGNTVQIGDGSTGDINGINRTADQIAAAVDDATVEIASNKIQVKDLGIGTAKLANTSVTAAKLGSDVAGDGLTGGNGGDIDVQPDTTGGANLAKVINVNSSGVSVKIDDTTIGENISGQLEVKDDGITAAKVNANVAGTGISQAAGGALDLDINELTEETTPANGDFIAIYDVSVPAHRKITKSNLFATFNVENVVQEMHAITAGEDTAGYFTLTQTPVNAQCVRVTPVSGPMQTSKQAVGSTGAQPDFDLLNTNQVHFNNNGAGTGLSGDLESGDVVIVEYQV